MVSLKCSDMGGPCDEVITGDDKAQLKANAMQHVKDKHAEMLPDIENMTPEQNAAWDADFNAKVDAQGEDRPMTDEERHEEKEVEMI